MADLVTRILLDNKNFDDNIARSKQQLQTFNDMTSSVKDVIGKFAVGIGIAGGAMETFNKFIEAGQGTADDWSFAIGTAKDTVDVFFTSLNTGDFTVFNKGILNTIKNLHELQRLRDDLADTKKSTNVMRSQYSYQAQGLKAIINNPDSTPAQVEAAKNKLIKITKDFAKQLEGQNKINIEELIKNARTKTGRYYTQNDINNFATVYNNPASQDPRKKKFDDFNEKMNALESKLYTTTTTYTNHGAVTIKGKDSRIEREIQNLKRQNNELDRMRILSKQGDAQWTEYYTSAGEYFDTKKEIEENLNFAIKQQNKANNRLTKSTGKKNTKKDPEIVYKEGSVGYLDKQITDYKKKMEQATTDASRQGFAKVIKELENEKIQLQFVAEYGKIKDVKEQKINGVLGDRTKGTDFSKISTKPLTDKITKKDIKINNDFADSLMLIGDVMNNLSGAMDDNGKKWLTFASTIMGAVASAIPAIQSLAMAEGIEQSQKVPFPANILAVASSMAAILAAFSQVKSTKKMAEGGVVYSSSFVNVGEYAGASTNPEIIAPLNKLKSLIKPSENNQQISGNVTFEIDGRKLVGVLSNYNKQQNRIR
jgi:hypothetical protein